MPNLPVPTLLILPFGVAAMRGGLVVLHLHPQEWLTERFAHVAESDPRFESSWYGLHIALLSHYFPYQQKFLIKPQPKIRESYEEEPSFSSIQAESSMLVDFDDSIVDETSITSTGIVTAPGSPYYIPDFTVTKATQYAAHDKLLLLIKVKAREPHNESQRSAYTSQMEDYMEAASQHLEKGASLVGLLICGNTVQVHRLVGPSAQTAVDHTPYELNGQVFHRLLHDISKANWDC